MPRASLDALPPGWQRFTDPACGVPYYHCPTSGQTQWTVPESAPSAPLCASLPPLLAATTIDGTAFASATASAVAAVPNTTSPPDQQQPQQPQQPRQVSSWRARSATAAQHTHWRAAVSSGALEAALSGQCSIGILRDGCVPPTYDGELPFLIDGNIELDVAVEEDPSLGYPGYDFSTSPHYATGVAALVYAFSTLAEVLRSAAGYAAARDADGARHAVSSAKVADNWLDEDWRACPSVSAGICVAAAARVLKLLSDGICSDGGVTGPRGRPIIYKVAHTPSVNVRSEPSTSSSIIGSFPTGHHVMGWPFGRWLELQAVESWVPPPAEALAAGYTALTRQLLERYMLIDGSHLGQGRLLEPVARYRGRLSSVQHFSERKQQKFKHPRAPAGRSRYRGQLEEDTLENEENDEFPHETDFDQHTDDQLSSGEPDADSFV
jgi:hypothetical protein